jgi:hypothetical protein
MIVGTFFFSVFSKYSHYPFAPAVKQQFRRILFRCMYVCKSGPVFVFDVFQLTGNYITEVIMSLLGSKSTKWRN